MIGISLTPAALFVLTPILSKTSRFEWLVARPQPMAVLGPTGLDLDLQSVGTRSFRWEEMGSMHLHHGLRTTGELQDPDGRTLATIPEALLFPRGAHWWDDGDTLAQSIVRARPERYELTGPKGLVGRPHEFDLLGRGTALDVPAWRRRQNLILWGLLLVSMLTIWFALAAPTVVDR